MSACCGNGNFCDFPYCDCDGNAEYRRKNGIAERGPTVPESTGRPMNIALTTGSVDFLKPGNGDRRFWPIVDKINEPAWIESLRWQLLSISDWFAERRMWRTSIAIDRAVLAIYRAFSRGGNPSAGAKQ